MGARWKKASVTRRPVHPQEGRKRGSPGNNRKGQKEKTTKSHKMGGRGGKVCFQLMPKGKKGGPSVPERKKKGGEQKYKGAQLKDEDKGGGQGVEKVWNLRRTCTGQQSLKKRGGNCQPIYIEQKKLCQIGLIDDFQGKKRGTKGLIQCTAAVP